MRKLSCIAALTLLPLTFGCKTLAENIAGHLAKRNFAPYQAHATISNSFKSCFRGAGGACNPPRVFTAPLTTASLLVEPSKNLAPSDPAFRVLQESDAVLSDPITTRTLDLYNGLEGTANNNDVTFKLTDIDDFDTRLGRATADGAWDRLAEYKAHAYEKLLGAPNMTAEQLDRAANDARTTAFLKAYFEAYFRNGKFIQVDTNISDELKAELARQLPNLSEEERTRMVAAITKKYGNPTFGAIGSDAFVTRDGTSLQIPAIKAEVIVAAKISTKVSPFDATAIGGDLIRVFFEALFDARDQLRGVSNATGVVGVQPEFALLSQADKKQKSPISDAEFGSVEERANMADAAASAVFGRIVRGGGWISLNNEAVAKLLENVVGVVVKKVVEKAVWCWYACNPSESPKAAWESLARETHDQTVTVHIE